MSRLREWEAALEASVVAVEHEPLCRSNTSVTDGGFGSCDCSRDTRIAKGMARALAECGSDSGPCSAHRAAALTAFVEASR